jgi:hypothetical protein
MMMRMAALIVVVAASIGPVALSPDTFDALQALIRPQPGEFAWYDEIPWLTSIQEAREKAAAEGKPILVWCSADGQPCGAT